MHSQWCTPSYKFIDSNARSDMPLIHPRLETLKPSVAWCDSLKPSLAYPQPPTQELNKTRQQLLASRAASNYINYCNDINNPSRLTFQPTTCCCPHRPLAREMARHALYEDWRQGMTPGPVNEDLLRETVLMERTNILKNNKCICAPCSQHQLMVRNPATRPLTSSGVGLEEVRSRSRLGSACRVEVPGDEITGVDIRSSAAKQLYKPLANGDVTTKTRATSVMCDVNKTSQLNERRAATDAAKNALMTIYQAGKADNQFHVRAPSTVVLKSMLAMLSASASGITVERAEDWMADSGREDVRCLPVNCGQVKPVSCVVSSKEPVRVHMEFPAETDTKVSFRLRSRPT